MARHYAMRSIPPGSCHQPSDLPASLTERARSRGAFYSLGLIILLTYRLGKRRNVSIGMRELFGIQCRTSEVKSKTGCGLSIHTSCGNIAKVGGPSDVVSPKSRSPGPKATQDPIAPKSLKSSEFISKALAANYAPRLAQEASPCKLP